VFFFQAEDGIRDKLVTGVQTCALPIWMCPRNVCICLRAGLISNCPAYLRRCWPRKSKPSSIEVRWVFIGESSSPRSPRNWTTSRSEERRVGKEGKSRVEQDDEKRKKTA